MDKVGADQQRHALIDDHRQVRELLLSHAQLMWQAECENAARYASRIQLASGAAVALLGLGFFGIVWTYQIPSAPMLPLWAIVTLHILLTALVILLLIAIGRLFMRPQSRGGNASDNLAFSHADIGTGKGAREALLAKLVDAYDDLKDRNSRERLRLRRGQEFLHYAIGLLFVIVLFYLWASLPAKMHPREAVHESSNIQSAGSS